MTRRKATDQTGVEDKLLILEDSSQEPVADVNVLEVSEAGALVIEVHGGTMGLVIASEDPFADDKIGIDARPNRTERAGYMTIVYRGNADSISYGAYRFRPGQPAKLPSMVAEELLRHPFERFEVKEF